MDQQSSFGVGIVQSATHGHQLPSDEDFGAYLPLGCSSCFVRMSPTTSPDEAKIIKPNPTVKIEIGAWKIIAKRLIERNLELEEIDVLNRKIFCWDVHHKNRVKEVRSIYDGKESVRLAGKGQSILSQAQTCSKYECEDDVKFFENRIAQGHKAGSSVGCACFFDNINHIEAGSHINV
ncbi:uncharacterized protein LOC135706753 [Ochlerotatus camptorhynchus]|uniref:uncharacterized protein LOC135706753 n=1 Tax=Ochlerotatus camptorhynchus TaxID=644619 RepID=UPI0031D0696C